MPEGMARAQRWPHGALRAGRAAAFLTLATGVNGTIAAYVPTWEPRWIYIAVVGLVAALDGWVIGLFAAAGAVVCYELMSFGAFRFVADRDALLFAAAIVAAVAARALRLAMQRPEPIPSIERPRLTGFAEGPPPAADIALQEASLTLRRALDEERMRSERERGLRLEQENRSREALEALAAELRAARTQINELKEQQAAFRSDAAMNDASLRNSAARVEELERSAADLRSSLNDARDARTSAERRIADLEEQLRSAREDRAAEERSASEMKARLRDLEEERSELQNQLADVAVARDAANARAEAADNQIAQLKSHLAAIEVARQDSDGRAHDLQFSLTQLRHQLSEAESSLANADQRSARLELLADELRAQLASAEGARAELARIAEATAESDARHRAEIDDLRSRLAAEETRREDLARAAEAAAQASALQRAEFDQVKYRLESEWNEKLARNAVELTDRLNAAMMQADARLDAARNEAAALLQRIADLERENNEYRLQLEATSGTTVDLNARLHQLENENAEIRTSSADLRAKLDAEWREKVEERETAIERMAVSLSIADQRAKSSAQDAEILRVQIEELRKDAAKLQEAALASEQAGGEIQALREEVARLSGELEQMRSAHAQAVETSETLLARSQELESENQTLVAAAQLSWEAEDATGALRSRVAALEAELQAAGGVSSEDRLRIETEWSEKFARSAMEITQRFQAELTAASEESARYREEVARLTDRLTAMKEENDAIREAAAAEAARIDSEWSDKLQTIVGHLASDHEHDMGEAVLEREEAKAEARRLSNKLSQFESRARDVAAAVEELQHQNAALQSQVEELKQRPVTAGQSDAEWSAKLAANALELTQRFNAAMATAEGRIQEAKREAQNLGARIKELEQINSTLRVADQERRAAIDAEWSEKLETIVNHLATDHEADVGQAMMEREEARAEGRMQAKKAEKLQKTLEEQFALFERARGEWQSEREQLLRSIDVLRRRMGLGTYSGTTPVPQPEAPERTTPSVLVVHRDSAVRAIAKHALEGSGYDVTTASDGLEAFRVATAQHPDVILAEASMPKMDGRELVQMLKSRPDTAAVKIVLMADSHGESGRYSMSDFRADDFLRDPANVEMLKSTLANVLGA